ncbi:MAG: ABC transporter permease subunit [Rhodospirillaceae bacterium]|nr:ABC transporter permease subunit [Rhodospirillaceae bacterium]
MIGRIMSHEWRLLLREKLLFITIPIYAVLIMYGVYNGSAWRDFLTANTTAASAMADTNFSNLQAALARIESGAPFGPYEDPRNPGRFARTMAYENAAKLPSPTAGIAIGQSDVYPSYLRVQWRALFNTSNTDEIENPTNLAVGRFDLSFVLIYLYPLLIIALSYNILSSERENGTQALLLSQPVSINQFVAGKILSRGIIIVGIAVGMSLLGMILSNPDILSGGGFARMVMWGLVIAVYGVFWFGLAVLVNAFANKSSTNALILMSGWLLLVLIVPAALNLISKSAYPLPSRIELVQAMRRGDALAQKEAAAAPTELSDPDSAELASRVGEEATLTSINNFNKRILPIELRGEAVAAPTFEKFQSQLAAQQALAERLKYLSPAILSHDAMSEIAGNSTASFADFRKQVAAYHKSWREYFYDRVMSDKMLTMEEIKGVPRFKYTPEADDTVMGRVFGSLVSLVVFSSVVLALGFAFLRRYPVAGR